MKKKNYRGVSCIKRTVSKCIGICKTYGELDTKYADMLAENDSVKEFETNRLFECDELKEYTSDFVGIRTDGSLFVRECVLMKLLVRPSVCKLLDASRKYWIEKGVRDWGIVVDDSKAGNI